ncbi:MAG TPA: FHA domain-containing protein [Kofleriaceae bacterium]|nr:FHA domain-containing protein [Kofleriaceae bacterium]
MIQVEVTERDGTVRHEVFDHDEVTVGRIAGSDLRFTEGSVSKRHARIVRRHDKFILVDLKSTNGTYVNGRKIASPLIVDEHDRVQIGSYVLSIGPPDELAEEPTIEVDAVELRLLAGIAQRDDEAWLVYADWLEGHGHATRAELLRLERLPIVERARHLDRIRELSATVDPSWRRKITRTAIENCFAFDAECPKQWGALEPTARSAVRQCTKCNKHVFYCATLNEARRQAQRGHCIAVDAANARTPYDLEYAPASGVRMGVLRASGPREPSPTPTEIRLPTDTAVTEPWPRR